MSDFSVNTSAIGRNADDLKALCSSINSIGESIKTISSNLHLKSLNELEIRTRLRIIHESILNEAVQMNSLSDALHTVSALYDKTEEAIINGDSVAANVASPVATSGIITIINQVISSIQEQIRTTLLALGIIDPQVQTRIDGQAVTQAQQSEHDLYMQSEIGKLRSNPRYSDATWKKASVEERKAILNEYIRDASGIMGLDFDEIKFEYHEPDENGYTLNGYYSSSRDIIMLNEYVIEKRSSPQSVFSTIQHELRHAYQYEVIRNPERYVVTEATAEAWAKSFRNYKDQEAFMAEGMSAYDAFVAYQNQAIEKDARKFAKQF